MRRIYQEFFYIPQHGRITDKVMTTRVIAMVVAVIVCLTGMSLSAYAYFSHSASSSSVLAAAEFKVEVTINDGAVPVVSEGYTHTALLPVGNTTVCVRSIGTAKNGYGIITLDGDDTVYHTQQITDDGTVTFHVHTDIETKLVLEAQWGTSSRYASEPREGYLVDGDALEIVTEIESIIQQEGTATTTTTATTTGTTTTAVITTTTKATTATAATTTTTATTPTATTTTTTTAVVTTGVEELATTETAVTTVTETTVDNTEPTTETTEQIQTNEPTG